MAKSAAQKPWEHAKAGDGSGTDPIAARFVSSLDTDRRMYKQDIAGSRAHVRMLEHVELLTADQRRTIEQGLDQIESEIEAEGEAWSGWRTELEDVHMCIEAALIERVGEVGQMLHTGRSRNDQIATDLLLWIEDAAAALDDQFTDLLAAFVELAERDGRLVMPSYTHLQRAQPIVAGAELLGWAAALDRSRRRLMALKGINQRNPLGAGAIAGSGLPLDRSHTSAALQIGPPNLNSIDATATRDAAIDFVYALSMTAMTLSRWAEQWIIYASTEFGFLQLDARYTTGSSMMPQKQNPDMLELIRGRCGDLYGRLNALLTMCKGLTVGYNRDLQEDKRHIIPAYDALSDCLAIAAGIVRTARFDEARIGAGLDRGFLDATALADYLVNRGVAFRRAHQLVGQLVQQCQQQGYDRLQDVPLAVLNGVCESDVTCDESVYQWLGPEQVVRRYQSEGNAGLAGFEQQMTDWRQWLAQRGREPQSDAGNHG
jgi:argininosuccinate lyase